MAKGSVGKVKGKNRITKQQDAEKKQGKKNDDCYESVGTMNHTILKFISMK